VEVNASDNGSGVASVRLLVDGITVESDTASPFSISWDSRTVQNGNRVLQAVAVDEAGNQGNSTLVSVNVQNTGPNLTGGLIGYWRFDETSGQTAGEASGAGNIGNYLNGAVTTVGRLNRALYLDGIDDYVRVPSSNALETNRTALSFATWVNVSSNDTWQAVFRKVIEEGSHTFPYSAYDLIVENSSGVLRARMAISRDDDVRATVYTTSALNYGSWYHVAGVFDGSSLRIYLNGSMEASKSFSGLIRESSAPLLIGRNGGGGDSFKGMIDDLRIYGRALSASEIQSLASARVPSAPVGVVTTDP
jgi:hypothetical protein